MSDSTSLNWLVFCSNAVAPVPPEGNCRVNYSTDSTSYNWNGIYFLWMSLGFPFFTGQPPWQICIDADLPQTQP